MTFKKNDVLEVKNYALWLFLLEYAESMSVPIFPTERLEKDFKQYPNLLWDRECLVGFSGTKASFTKNWITIEQFLEYCDNYEKEKEIEIVLTESYNALINKTDKTITVGCQTIPFSKITEIFNLINTK